MLGGVPFDDAHGGARARHEWDRRIRHAMSGARVVIFGGAGFLGSHLAEALVHAGASVIAVDNLITGKRANLAGIPNVTFVESDICSPPRIRGGVDFVLNLASIASPPIYSQYPIETLRVGSVGVENALRLALENDSVFFQASTSEVYGDPSVSPQPEDYWGNVNPVGPRSMYDESKRFAEAMAVAFASHHDLDIRIARIFNTYGPRMDIDDGRAVPSFVKAAFKGSPLPVHGDGMQTRSLCYVDDLVEGILRLLVTSHRCPVNLGNTHEVPIIQLAETIIDLVGSTSELAYEPRPGDDPQQRRPDISLAQELLDFEPGFGLEFGLMRTIVWFAEEIGHDLVIDLDRTPVKLH